MSFAPRLRCLVMTFCIAVIAAACGAAVEPETRSDSEGGIVVDDASSPACPAMLIDSSPCPHSAQICTRARACLACGADRYTATDDQYICLAGRWSALDMRLDCSGVRTPLCADSACVQRVNDVPDARVIDDAAAPPPPDATVGACGPGLACAGGGCSGPPVCQQCMGELWTRLPAQFICQGGRLEAVHVDCAGPSSQTFSDPACTHPSVLPDAG